ncbi:MAG: hypothetical protein FWE74_01445 [Oscillospiraceae bacterium]|nr:hypothetical protein [Oscillospiraceae bacterium]
MINGNDFREKYKPILQSINTPRYVYKTADINCALLQGEDIKTHVKGCGEIIIFAATLGFQADELIRRTEAYDMAGAVVLDALASELIEKACDEAEVEIRAKYKKITARFSPGYGDFPLEVQGGLLLFLGAKKRIGLYANENNLLIPRKSVTAVIGVKTQVVKPPALPAKRE